MDFWKLNVAMKKDPYPLPCIDEVFNIVASHKIYSILNGFFRYMMISIALENWYKITFVIDWGACVGVVMLFGVKNGPPTYQHDVSKTFREYIDIHQYFPR
jgi:hypothetical protein